MQALPGALGPGGERVKRQAALKGKWKTRQNPRLLLLLLVCASEEESKQLNAANRRRFAT